MFSLFFAKGSWVMAGKVLGKWLNRIQAWIVPLNIDEIIWIVPPKIASNHAAFTKATKSNQLPHFLI